MTIGKKDYAIYDKSCLKEGDRLETEYKEDCVIYRLSNDTGTGTVTEYPVFDGVSLLIDDMHMYAFGEGSSGSAMLVIEHCKEGRFEADFADGRQFYIGKGDICVHNMDYGEILFSAMPIRHYHGVTVMIRHDRDEEVLAAAKAANCDEFVSKLPDGYNTMIGENGSMLSGGERQRISIARALLKDAPIVLLDEATASLDVENETQIQKAISKLVKDKTVLIIAHRMRTVAGADKLIVLKDGVVAEQGSPDELYKKNGIYTQMADMQRKSVNWKI